MNTKKKLNALKEYTEYWDQWHFEWYEQMSNRSEDVKNWIVPIGKGGNDNPIQNYFPEPYWGNLDHELKAVFLNINPGAGNKNQDFKDSQRNYSPLFINYQKSNRVYSQTVAELSNNIEYKTTKWMFNKRVNWLRNVLNSNTIQVADVLFADLIPWHTKSRSDIAKYSQDKRVTEQIIKFVIKPLSKIVFDVNSKLKGKLIIRSSLILDILNTYTSQNRLDLRKVGEYVVLDKSKYFSKFSSFLTIFEYNKAKFYVFSGGSSMALPKPEYIVQSVSESGSIYIEPKSLQQFILK